MTTTTIQESCSKMTQPTPAPPVGTQVIEPRGIAAYPSFPECRFLTDMRVTTTTTKKWVNSHKGHSAKYTPPTPALTAVNADNGVQRDYEIPIHSR